MDKNKLNEILNEYIKNPSLIKHSKMVALAMEHYASMYMLPGSEVFEWYTAGLLHDLDWEMYPEEHPNYSIEHILPTLQISNQVINAIRAHAPQITGYYPTTKMETHLFACDEISGFINAVTLVRPNGIKDLEPKSVIKRLKEKSFAANVNRDDIYKGLDLIGINLEEHIKNLIIAFSASDLFNK